MPIPIVLQLVEKRLIGETPAISRGRCRCVASSPDDPAQSCRGAERSRRKTGLRELNPGDHRTLDAKNPLDSASFVDLVAAD